MAVRRRNAVWVGLGIAAVALLVVGLPTVTGMSDQILHHAVCVTGSPIASTILWTPVAIVDSPPSTNGTQTYANASAWAPGLRPVFLNLSDGEAGGVFSLDRWVLLPQALQWIAGPGAVPSCASQMLEDASRTLGQPSQPEENFSQFLPIDSTSDLGVPDNVSMAAANGTVYGSVNFVANYSLGMVNRSFDDYTWFDEIGKGIWQTNSQSSVGGTFFVGVPFVDPSGRPHMYSGWMTGVTSELYVLQGPWYGCIQWEWSIGNPFGTGLSFGPGPSSRFACAYP